MLKLQNITKTFNRGTVNEKIIFDKFNLHIAEGEFVSVIGSNGSGKSTLMNLIAGKLTPDYGQIILDGKDASNQSEHVRARHIGRVFQDPLMGTASDMRIYENLALASKKGKHMGLRWCVSKHDLKKFTAIMSDLDLNLEKHLNTEIGMLSGGQRQALTLLMATMQKPKLLLLDEHTSALDPKTAQKVLAQTENIIKQNKLTTLMITHNMDDAIRFGTRLIMLSNGKITLDVSGDEKRTLSSEFLFKKFSEAERNI